VISVASEKKDARDDMVCEHLPMIFSSLFDIDNHNLLEPKGELREYIPFQETLYLSIWPIGPDSFDVEPVIGIIHNVLLSSQRSRRVGRARKIYAHHPKRPEHRVIYQKPSLLCEPCSVILLLNAKPFRQRCKYKIYDARSQSRKEYNPVDHHTGITPIQSILARFWIVI
jgi:hypothetical protein